MREEGGRRKEEGGKEEGERRKEEGVNLLLPPSSFHLPQ
jgi:hypothetical protein